MTLDISRMDEMSKDKVRAAQNSLGRKNINGRHVNCICAIGAVRFHGKVHLHQIDGKYYLETMAVALVNKEIDKEMAKWPKKNEERSPCVWNTVAKEQPQNEKRPEKPQTLRVPPRPEGDSNYAVA